MLNHKFTIPKLSTQVQLNVPDGLFGLNNRVTANESIVYLENVLRTLRGKLEALMPANNAAFLSQFFSQTVDTVNDLRLYIYRCISRRLINVCSHSCCFLSVFLMQTPKHRWTESSIKSTRSTGR